MTPPTRVDGIKRIISVYAPKGGVGCTTLASNLAVALQSDTTPVILVDSRLHFGGVGISFNERSKHSLSDLTPRVEHLDSEVVNGVVITHVGSSVRLLPAPEKISDAESIDPSQISPLLNYLSTLYTYVIVDTSSELTEHTLAVLDTSGLVLLLTTQDIPSLDRLRRFLELAPSIGLNKERFRIILSRFNERINITPERIRQNFKQEIASVIPNDSSVVSPATNQGAPFMMDKRIKGRPIHKAFVDLAKMIARETDITG
jgi:pilus assembly protein CpaE